MARPKKDDKKEAQIPMRVTVEEKAALYAVAANRGMYFSQMILLDYLQKSPTVTFAPPDREKLIKMIIVISDIVSFLDDKIKKINPQGLEVMELIRGLTNEQIQEYYKLDSAKQGALIIFLNFQSDLNGYSKG